MSAWDLMSPASLTVPCCASRLLCAMRTGTTRASHLPWVGRTGGVPAWGVPTTGEAWRGDAAGDTPSRTGEDSPQPPLPPAALTLTEDTTVASCPSEARASTTSAKGELERRRVGDGWGKQEKGKGRGRKCEWVKGRSISLLLLLTETCQYDLKWSAEVVRFIFTSLPREVSCEELENTQMILDPRYSSEQERIRLPVLYYVIVWDRCVCSNQSQYE